MFEIPILYCNKENFMKSLSMRDGYRLIYRYEYKGLYYIGQTKNLRIRHLNHRHDSLRNRQFINSILIKHPEILPETIWMGLSEDTDDAERHYIREYDSLYPNGYNFESGGCRYKELSEDVRERISQSVRRKFKSEPNVREKQRSSMMTYAKPILQYTMDGEFVREFDSMEEARIAVNLKSGAGISQVCNGKGKNVAGGYQWRFKTEDYPLRIESVSPRVKVRNTHKEPEEPHVPRYVHLFGKMNHRYGTSWSEEHKRILSEKSKLQWAEADEETRGKWLNNLKNLNLEKMKPILQYDSEGNFIREFENVHELMEVYDISKT